MLKTLFNWILKTLFGVKTETNNTEMTMNDKFAQEYRAIDEINFTSIFANKLANFAVSDSTVNIVGNNKRTEMLTDTLNLAMTRAKKIVGMQLGYGGVCIVPYIDNGKLLYTLVEQDRLTIDQISGEKITGATLLAEQKTITSGSISNTYFRWVNYTIENNVIIMRQKYTDQQGSEIDVNLIPEWASINPEERIMNVDRVLFGYTKSPINNRIGNDKYGVPITFGCDHTIAEIKECLKQIAREFALKEAFVGIDERMFGKDSQGRSKLPRNGLFKTFKSDTDTDFFQEFSPAIRESSYYARLQELYTRLEKEIGVSKGFLTDMESSNATATEIRRAMYDTFTLVNDIRKNFEKGMEDFIYACNVLANRYNLSPLGDYELAFNWDYSLLTDTQEEFNHYIQGVSQGVISKAELRNWIIPNETLEESKKAIEEIEEETPSVDKLLVDEKDDADNDKDKQNNKEDNKDDKKNKGNEEKE
jgi:A118 family predicted phage portal protein